MLEQSIFIALSVLAIWATMWNGMIFGFIREYGDQRLPEYIQKPLYDCPICGTPYYGTLIYLFKYGVTENMVWVILMAMGWNVLVVKFLPENWYTPEDIPEN